LQLRARGAGRACEQCTNAQTSDGAHELLLLARARRLLLLHCVYAPNEPTGLAAGICPKHFCTMYIFAYDVAMNIAHSSVSTVILAQYILTQKQKEKPKRNFRSELRSTPKKKLDN
jgi:hypothetical protein